MLFADYAYGWGSGDVGWVLGAVGVMSVIVNAVLVKRIVGAIGERRALLLGLSCGVVGFTIYGFAPTGAVFLMGMPIMALWALAMPSTQAMVTREVGPEVQGRVQGALTSLASLAGIVAPMRLHHGVRVVHRADIRRGNCRARRSCWRACCLRARGWWRGVTPRRTRSARDVRDDGEYRSCDANARESRRRPSRPRCRSRSGTARRRVPSIPSRRSRRCARRSPRTDGPPPATSHSD